MLSVTVMLNVNGSPVVPVVGVPLPLVSYGGTSMMTLLFGFGLLMCVYIHRDVIIPRRPETIGL